MIRLLLLALLLSGCASAPISTVPGSIAPSADARFEAQREQMLDDMWRAFPEAGVQSGFYKYADQMTIPDAPQRARAAAFYQRQLAALAAIDAQQLNASNKVDLSLMQNHFASEEWHLNTFKAWQWQPTHYNVGDSFWLLLTTEYAPLDTRLGHVLARLEQVPAYYAAAKASIVNPTREHLQLAVIQNRGALAVFGEDLRRSVAASGLAAAEKARFTVLIAAARGAIEDYVSFLAALEASNPSPRSFRIGTSLYAQKFAFDIQSGFSAEALYQLALAEKRKLHEAMDDIAKTLWPKVMPTTTMPADHLLRIRAVIDELSKRHTSRDAFVATIAKHVPTLEAFVRDKDLLDQDPTRPLRVREMPFYMRGGGAVASVSAPGPYDPQANTYYNATPLDAFTAEEAESILREYNDWILQILNIHEGVPGHYTQLMHANKSKSAVKAIFGNGSMIEGWAVYSEKMMLDAGYGDFAPEMWLMWMKWNLRTVVNTILDYEIHNADLSREAAIRLLTREAFQQTAEAAEKWRRATFTQVQLTSYFNGYAEITALRDDEKRRLGKDFSVKAFNNKFLSYGSAPVRDIRRLMRSGE